MDKKWVHGRNQSKKGQVFGSNIGFRGLLR